MSYHELFIESILRVGDVTMGHDVIEVTNYIWIYSIKTHGSKISFIGELYIREGKARVNCYINLGQMRDRLQPARFQLGAEKCERGEVTLGDRLSAWMCCDLKTQ